MISLLPWLMSALTIVQLWLTGNRWRYVWLFALGNGAIWTVWTVASGTWGMMPLNLVSAVVAWRNHRLWSKA